MNPKLTVGMATFNDFDGCYFTIQSLRLYQHRFEERLRNDEIELLIVDNSPGGSHSQMLVGLCSAAKVRYIPLQTPTGTSPSRNKVFEEARGDFVLCVDSHVLLGDKTATDRLCKSQSEYGTGTPTASCLDDLFQGPMISDDLQGICTHFNPEWRSEMFGIWGRAWQCPCGRIASNMTCVERNDRVAFFSIPKYEPLLSCPVCRTQLPDIPWAAHEAELLRLGYKSLGLSTYDQPFEIPGQGLGLFGCRREAWLKFVEHSIGFGGEEMNIHEAYRQAGHTTFCVPWLRWIHKFGRPSGVPYPLDRYQKVRNYVLWHRRLNKPLDDIHQHFVKSHLFSKEEWDWLVQDPVNHTTPDIKPAGGCGGCGSQSQQNVQLPDTIDGIFDHVRAIERDFNQHMPKLRELADDCDTVVDISLRQESFIALAASKAKRVFSYSNEFLFPAQKVLDLKGKDASRLRIDPATVIDIPPCDLLFLNTRHTADQVYRELRFFSPIVKRYIVLHNTQIYGERGEGHSDQAQVAGILVAVRKFLRDNPVWSVVYHTQDQYGLTVLSCKQEDKKRLPSAFKMVTNFAKASAEHLANGLKKVDLPVLEARMDVCAGCEQRVDDRCSVCGCFIHEKASWRSSECPLGLWTTPTETSVTNG